MKKINLKEKANLITEHWKPVIIGELNGQYVKLAKIKGEFTWHKHENEDEMFQVVDGWFEMHLRDRIIELQKGDIFIVPKGIEHKPVAPSECLIMLFEPKSTINTGNQINDFTKFDLDLA